MKIQSRRERQIHFGMASLTLVLLWTSSLSACRSLASGILQLRDPPFEWTYFDSKFDNFELRYDLETLIDLLRVEGERFEECVERQYNSCNIALSLAVAQEYTRTSKGLRESENAAKQIREQVQICEREMYSECEKESNQTKVDKFNEILSRNAQAQEQLDALERSAEASSDLRHSFWLALECARPDGDCPHSASLSDQFQSVVATFEDIHRFNTQEAERFNARVRARIEAADRFIDSVRAVSDSLAAVGIHLGVPGASPPLPSLGLASFPSLMSVEAMFDQAMRERIEDVRRKEEAASQAISRAVSGQRQAMNDSSLKDPADGLGEHVRNGTASAVGSARNASEGLSVPSSLRTGSEEARRLVLERLGVAEELLEAARALGRLIVNLDLVYRLYRGAAVIARAVAATSVSGGDGHEAFYDGRALLAPGHARCRNRALLLLSSARATDIVALILGFAAFLTALGTAYAPVWRDFEPGCLEPGSGNLEGNMLSRNAAAVAYQWVSGDGSVELQDRARQVQVSATGICVNATAETSGAFGEIEERVVADLNYLRSLVPCGQQQLGNRTCDADEIGNRLWWNSERAVFHCERLLEHCTLDCSGPSELLVSGITAQATCRTQYQLHFHVQWMAAAAVLFGAMNLGRALLVSGMLKILLAARLTGASLRPILWAYHADSGELARVELESQCTGRGQKNEGVSQEQVIRKFFDECVATDEWVGWGLVGLSAALYLSGILFAMYYW